MSRGWRIALALVALLVAVNLVLRFLGTLTGGTPGGPRSSSYATSSRGAAAYAELLGRNGHPIDQERKLPHQAPPGVATTVFLLDPPSVGTQDLAALRRYVQSGGHLVASGLSPHAMHQLVAKVPTRVRGPSVVHEDGLAIKTGGATEWRDENLVAVRRTGRGTVVFLADSSPLQNRLLGSADDAAFGLALAGPRHRPVEFLESYHGYGTGTGLSALPRSWKLLLGGLGLASLVLGRMPRGLRDAGAGRPESPAATPRVRRFARRGGRAQQAPQCRGRA